MSNMPEIIIDGVRFDDMTPMKYWSFPKSYSKEKKKMEAFTAANSGQYIGARKMDGFWGMIVRDMEGQFHLRSRTESVNGGYTDKAEWIPWITEGLKNIPNGTVLIGEVYFPNNEGSRKITTVLNCLKEKCIKRQESGDKLNFYVFDILAFDGKDLIDTPIEKRVNTYLIDKLAPLVPNEFVQIANYLEGPELWEMYQDVLAVGGEGIVITRKDCSYLCGKRTAHLTIKLKKELLDTIDAFVTGNYKVAKIEYEGKEIKTWKFWQNSKTGEKFCKECFDEYVSGATIEPITKAAYYGWASSIEFAVMRDGVVTPIAWISGITDEVKKDIVENPERLKNKVAELTAMEIECISGVCSLRHGKIEKWREDKNPEDCDYSQLG